MSSIATRQALTPRELRKWPEPVSTALLAIVNRRGVRHRIIDGNHLLLYPPERTARPVKFSASRPAEANLHFLDEFTTKYLGPVTPEPRDDRPATEAEIAPLVGLNGDRHQAETPEAETEEWRPHLTKDGKSTTFETNGRVFRCTECGWITETGALGTHAARHARIANMVEIPNLTRILNACSITRRQVAQEFGINRTALAAWEKVGRIKPKYLPQLAALLDVRVSDLTGQTEPEPAPEPQPETPAPAEPILDPMPEPAPEPVTEPASEPTDAQSVLRQIARLIDDALGRDNLETELRDTRARLEEAKAQLDLIREAIGLAK